MDWSQGLADLAWRDWLLVLILVVAVYMLAVYFRWQRVNQHHQKERAAAAQAALPKEPRYAPPARNAYVPERPLRGIETRADELARDPLAALTRANADHDAMLERLRQENAQLKEELAALRSSFATVRDELRQDIAKLKAGQQVSPLYGDSMQMALAGASAEMIAARCGVARAEAELVIALVRSRQGDEPNCENGEFAGEFAGEAGYGMPDSPPADGAAREENKNGRAKPRGPY